MTIEFRCGACAARYTAKTKHAGKKTTCKKCLAPLEVPFPPLELPLEVTDGGSVVYRHEEGTRDPEPAAGNERNIELISDHIQRHLGEVDNVFHEIISDLVHVDIHCVAPTAERPYHTLVTSGMSDRRMSVPPEAAECGYAELMISLPPDWPLTQEAFRDVNHFWPIQWLKILARFPHEYDTWLFEGHTFPNGDPAEPFAGNTSFSGWLLFPPILAPKEFCELKVDDEKTIHFFAIYPLYDGEMDLKLTTGTDALIERLARQTVTEIVAIGRNDTTKRGL